MAKHVIRYFLDGDGSVPKFVGNGGYFIKQNQLIGISIDDEQRYLPDSVIKLNKQDLINWVTLCEVKSIDKVLLNAEEIEDLVDYFLESNGLIGYA